MVMTRVLVINCRVNNLHNIYLSMLTTHAYTIFVQNTAKNKTTMSFIQLLKSCYCIV